MAIHQDRILLRCAAQDRPGDVLVRARFGRLFQVGVKQKGLIVLVDVATMHVFNLYRKDLRAMLREFEE